MIGWDEMHLGHTLVGSDEMCLHFELADYHCSNYSQLLIPNQSFP